jgi:hypothetical protein
MKCAKIIVLLFFYFTATLCFSDENINLMRLSSSECESKLGKPVKVIKTQNKSSQMKETKRVYKKGEYIITVSFFKDVAIAISYIKGKSYLDITEKKKVKTISKKEISDILKSYADEKEWSRMPKFDSDKIKSLYCKRKHFIVLLVENSAVVISDSRLFGIGNEKSE